MTTLIAPKLSTIVQSGDGVKAKTSEWLITLISELIPIILKRTTSAHFPDSNEKANEAQHSLAFFSKVILCTKD